MPNRFSAFLLTVILVAASILSFLLKPLESRADSRSGWTGEYFTNPHLEGTPLVTAVDETIDMNWYTSAPYKELPTDYFSVRWTRTITIDAGVYRFRVGADDGFRLRIDGKTVIDSFEEGTFRDLTRDVRLSKGSHQVVVEYFEAQEVAGVLVEWGVSENPSSILDLETETVETLTEPVTPAPIYGYVARSSTPLYANPLITASLISHISLYQKYAILGTSPDGAWYQVEIAAGLRGWLPVDSLYVDTPATLPQIKVSSSNLYVEVEGMAVAPLTLRDAPQGAFLEQVIPDDAPLKILARDENSQWLYVAWQPTPEAEFMVGWVYSPYIQLTIGTLADLDIH